MRKRRAKAQKGRSRQRVRSNVASLPADEGDELSSSSDDDEAHVLDRRQLREEQQNQEDDDGRVGGGYKRVKNPTVAEDDEDYEDIETVKREINEEHVAFCCYKCTCPQARKDKVFKIDSTDLYVQTGHGRVCHRKCW
jgi:hypothetical protein